jgi:hypothetical protein
VEATLCAFVDCNGETLLAEYLLVNPPLIGDAVDLELAGGQGRQTERYRVHDRMWTLRHLDRPPRLQLWCAKIVSQEELREAEARQPPAPLLPKLRGKRSAS